MKLLLPITLGALFAAAVTTSAFAQCGHEYNSADLSNLKIASEKQATEEAMSTHDPASIKLLLDNQSSDQPVEISE